MGRRRACNRSISANGNPAKAATRRWSGITPKVLHQAQRGETRRATRMRRSPRRGSERDPGGRGNRSAALITYAAPGAGCDAGADRCQARHGAPREYVAGNRDQRRHSCFRAAPANSRRPPSPCSTNSRRYCNHFPIPSASKDTPTTGRSRPPSFPSNWELSAARAASVVHQFTRQGIDPLRLEIVGFGEFHPRATNDTVEGRNANRRVVILVLEQLAQAAPTTAQPTQSAQSSQLRAAFSGRAALETRSHHTTHARVRHL